MLWGAVRAMMFSMHAGRHFPMVVFYTLKGNAFLVCRDTIIIATYSREYSCAPVKEMLQNRIQGTALKNAAKYDAENSVKECCDTM